MNSFVKVTDKRLVIGQQDFYHTVPWAILTAGILILILSISILELSMVAVEKNIQVFSHNITQKNLAYIALVELSSFFSFSTCGTVYLRKTQDIFIRQFFLN